MSISVKPHHPLKELLAKLLFGIETVSPKEQRKIVNRACKEAVRWHEIQKGKLRMDCETWYKIFCKNCDAINWVYDDTRNDIEGMKCHQCGFEDLWLEDEELELVSGGEPYEPDYVLGVEKPE